MQTLILIPGLGSDATVWERTIAALGDDAECRVGETLQDDSLAGMARRILASAPPSFCLAGVSMGGMVAMEIMKAAPERVRALALVDTNARPDSPEQTERRLAANAAMLAAADLRPLAVASLPALIHPASPRDVREAMIAMTIRVGAETYVRQNKAVAARDDLRALLPTITAPTYVICGEQDRLLPLPMSQEIQAAIPGAELHLIPDCGHLPPIEKPAETADLLRALMAKA